MSDFLNLVKAERQKQINKHGYTHEHDDEHIDGEIADAAACYANTINSNDELIPFWPWEPEYFKKEEKTRKEQIITACALLMAEYERLSRKFGIGSRGTKDTLTPVPYQMPCPYGFDSLDERTKNEDPISFAPRHHQKILDRTKIRTARKRDKSGEFTINGERFEAVFEIAVNADTFISLFKSGFYTPEQFGFESELALWKYYSEYFSDGGLIFVHKISEVQDEKNNH